jgi:hypothetical protein
MELRMPARLAALSWMTLMLASGAANAEELVACVHASKGTLRIVASASACSPRKETAVTWNVAGPEGPSGPAGPPGPSNALSVVDANGQSLGLLVGIQRGFSFTVFLPALESSVEIHRSGNVAPSGSSWFAEPGCTGQAFVDSDDAHLIWVSPERFFVPRVEPEKSVTVKSRLDSDGECVDDESQENAVPADEVDDLGIDFPVAVPLFIRSGPVD